MADFLEGALEKHWGELKGRGWPLVEAVTAYSNLLTKHRAHFLGEEERLRVRMCKLLEGLEGQLRDIAEVYALTPALSQGLKPCSSTDLAGRAEELLKRLEEMEKEEPSRQAAEWAALQEFKPEEFKLLAKGLRGLLTFTLAVYERLNDRLEAARELFKKSAEIDRELEGLKNYLVDYSMSIGCSMLGAGNLEELRRSARAFKDLWSEAKKHEIPIAVYHEGEAVALAGYLVSLTLEGKTCEASELLEEERLLSYLSDKGVAVRLLLELLGVRVRRPEAREIAAALRNHIYAVFRPALNAPMGLPGDALGECDELEGERREVCRMAVNVVNGDKDAATDLKLWSLDMLSEGLAVLLERGLVQDLEERKAILRFYSELLNFVEKRNARDLVQLWVPTDSLTSFTLMLWALANSDEELARALAKLAAISYWLKLPRRLFREAAEARSEEELKLALLKLFFLHI
jgi:hypothetical protein